jgi:sulfopyruvate decarboxylase alpha subunit
MSEAWHAAAFRRMRQAEIGVVGYVPDAGLKALIADCQADPAIRTVALTTEEEGIGLAAGAWLGGMRSALLMQSSGVGNVINALASVTRACRFPLLMIVTMRGDWGETNPWQVPMGQAVAPILTTLGAIVYRVTATEQADGVIEAALRMAYASGEATAVLIDQRVVGSKVFEPSAGAGGHG